MLPPLARTLLSRTRAFVSQERALVVGLAIVTGCVWVFIEILDEVLEGEAREVDDRVAAFLTDAAGEPVGPAWLVGVALDLTALGSGAVLLLIVALAAGFLALTRHSRQMWLLLAASVLGAVGSASIKGLIGRERPDETLHLAEVSSASFPSGHAMIGAVVWLTLAAVLSATRERRRERLYIIAGALLVTGIIGLTRVYLRVHYTTDVLAGWSVGLCWTVLCLAAARWVERRDEAMKRRKGEDTK